MDSTTEEFAEAAKEHDSFESLPSWTAAEYFQTRQRHLNDLPYGPFGDAVNAAILQARSSTGIDEFALAELADQMPPMLTLVLAAHLGCGQVRLLRRVKELLIDESSGSPV